MEKLPNYLHFSYAPQISHKKERRLYRLFEIVPGFLVWITLALMFLLSWKLPVAVSLFIIAFDVFWVSRAGYHAFLLQASYNQMRRNLNIDWQKKLGQLSIINYQLSISSPAELHHLVFLPVYKESPVILKRTLSALAQAAKRTPHLWVIISLEQRAGKAASQQLKALLKNFQGSFERLALYQHPAKLPGELPGKGSNLHFAGQKAKKELIDKNNIPYQKVLVSALDADTVVPADYFNRLSYAYLTAEKPLKSSYQPIPLFHNNLWQAPALARVIALSTTFWYMILQQKPERRGTFSSHSMPFAALVKAGFWQKNIVSEDSRIFYQNLLTHNGNYQVVPLYYPVSMDANVADSFWKTLRNQYLQQRRWAWGVENVPYLLYGFLKNKKIPFREKLAFVLTELEGFYSWATASILIFFLGWLPVVLGGAAFNATVLSYNLPKLTSYIMGAAMVGLVHIAFITVNLASKRYVQHFPGIQPPPSANQMSHLKNTVHLALQWILLPITLNVFGALPAIDAQTRLMLGRYLGFWPTEKG